MQPQDNQDLTKSPLEGSSSQKPSPAQSTSPQSNLVSHNEAVSDSKQAAASPSELQAAQDQRAPIGSDKEVKPFFSSSSAKDSKLDPAQTGSSNLSERDHQSTSPAIKHFSPKHVTSSEETQVFTGDTKAKEASAQYQAHTQAAQPNLDGPDSCHKANSTHTSAHHSHSDGSDLSSDVSSGARDNANKAAVNNSSSSDNGRSSSGNSGGSSNKGSGNSSSSEDDTQEAAVYDGAQADAEKEAMRPQRKRVFLRSLQFRIIWIVTLAGLISMTVMTVLYHYKLTKSTRDFVDEELSQIASVAINYRMIIPRRWEAPRHYHDRVLRLMQRDDGTIIMQLSVDNRKEEMRNIAQTPTDWFNEQERKANEHPMGRGQGGPGRGLGPGKGMGQGANNLDNHNLANWANQTATPSLSDLSNLNYDIMIAPLYGRPGDALYIPLGVSDGFYTVMVADERVRAFVATNANGQRFVVARPLSSLVEIMRQSFYASFLQFFLIDLIAIPLIIILSINFMLRSLNRLAQDLYHRSDEDLSPVVTHDGTQKGFIPSELDGFIISINRLFQRVDESMQSKRRFIADAAHEMRTQSTVLSLQIEALDNEDLPPSAQVKLKRLKQGIAREKSLMTSLLTLAREQGCVDLSLEQINIFELYTKLIEEQGLLADRKNIDLGVEGEVNFTLISDRSKLTRIMSNLLSNAIKYTPEDGRIDLKATQNADGSLTLLVQDDGPGIPPKHLKHILEPFYRVDGDRSAVQGTGLGLAIVKASCDSLKAQLKFANATPHGLIASVTLKDLPVPDIKEA